MMAQNLGMRIKIMPAMAQLLGRQESWEGPGMFKPRHVSASDGLHMLFTSQKCAALDSATSQRAEPQMAAGTAIPATAWSQTSKKEKGKIK